MESLQTEKIVRTVIHVGQKPTDAQIKEIEDASSRLIVVDEDAPELTLEQYKKMADIVRKKRCKESKA